MKKKKLTLKEFRVNSFVTTSAVDQMKHILGKSGCCLNMTGNDENCYTGPHMGACNSTGNTDDQTGAPGI